MPVFHGIDNLDSLDNAHARKNMNKTRKSSTPFAGYVGADQFDSEKDSLNSFNGNCKFNYNNEKRVPPRSKISTGRNFLAFLASHNGHHYLGDTLHPFYFLWVSLSSFYGVLLLIIMLALNLTEVMDNNVKLMSLQGIYLVYLYVGSICVIISIYVWVLADSCSSLNSSSSAELTRFGSLKRAHINPTKTSPTSFYLRIGALAFGLGTLIFVGLEMAMHSMMDISCLNDIGFLHPILHALFTFLQMHFLFVNSQVLVEKFGLIARFGFIHLAATNVAIWIRLVVWESSLEWIYFVHLAEIGGAVPYEEISIPTPLQLRGFPTFLSHRNNYYFSNGYNLSEKASLEMENNYFYRPISENHIKQVVSLHYCVNTNTLGQLFTSSMPFLYPFIIQFSVIAACVTFTLGQKVGLDRLQKSHHPCPPPIPTRKTEPSVRINNGFDCNGTSKGLFAGLLVIVVVVVVSVIFLVVKEDGDFPSHVLYWFTTGTLVAILVCCIFANALGLHRFHALPYHGENEISPLDRLLSGLAIAGVFLYAVFGVIVGINGVLLESQTEQDLKSHWLLTCGSLLHIVQCALQTTFMGEAVRRTCTTRQQQFAKPGRQIVTFLLCSNAALWAFDSFVTQSWLNQELQLRFYGLLLWGVVSRISLPLLALYRFHSFILLSHIWRKCYFSNTGHLDPY